MKILFLDDDIERHEKFARRTIGCQVTQVYSARSAIDKLTTEQFDLVFLDHDLGGPESENKMLENAEDGRMVARHIAENAERHSDCQFVVHSLNQAGREEMVRLLEDEGLTVYNVPFAWIKFQRIGNSIKF